jgi:hypothetical protein
MDSTFLQFFCQVHESQSEIAKHGNPLDILAFDIQPCFAVV